MKCLKLFIASMVLALAGCAATIPTATFNDKAAIGVQTATVVSQTFTQALRAKTITVAQDKVLQNQLDLVVQAIQIAKSIQLNDPVNASLQLTSALEQLDALKKQSVGAKP